MNEGDEFKVFGPDHMRVIELPLVEVNVDPTFNCRTAYRDDEIAAACATFDQEPMLHPPTVARIDEKWTLVAGFKRFAVWQVKHVEIGLFRWVEEADARKLMLANLSENVLRKQLRGHEIVEGITRLRELGVESLIIAKACDYSKRWVNRICKFKRSAHPELWKAFVEDKTEHMSLKRALDLADHDHDVQLRRLRQMLKAADNADEIARGYPDPDAELTAGPKSGAQPPRRRKRYPNRRFARAVETIIEREPTLTPDYRKGALDTLRWFVSGTEFPFKVTLSAFARERRNEPSDESGEQPIERGDDGDRAAE